MLLYEYLFAEENVYETRIGKLLVVFLYCMNCVQIYLKFEDPRVPVISTQRFRF